MQSNVAVAMSVWNTQNHPSAINGIISSNGNSVIFQSSYPASQYNTNFVDPNGEDDVYFSEMPLGPTLLISASHDGQATGNASSTDPVLSSNDRWVAFLSASTNLLSTNIALSGPALYVRDLLSNSTLVASVDPQDASILGGLRGRGTFSGDSRFLGFVDHDYRIIRRDLQDNESKLLAYEGQKPTLNGNGRFVAYEHRGNPTQIYVADADSGIAKLVSANLSGTNANGSSSSPLITPDGRFIVFQSVASDLVENDDNTASDIFVADRILGKVLLLTINFKGTATADGASSIAALSANGRVLVFQSHAPDLIAHDYNDRRDVFVATLSLPDSDGDGMDDDFEITYFGNLERNGAGDFDSDGQSDYHEFIAGTNPGSDSSIFRVISIAAPGAATRQVLWSSVAGRSYSVQFKDSLLDDWSTLPQTVRATSSTAAFVDNASTATRFYRVAALE
jgi:hypothetical protein